MFQNVILVSCWCVLLGHFALFYRYIAIVSGLNVGSAHCDQLSLQLFIDYITSTVDRAANRCSSVVRLIVAGNCITDNPVKSSTAVVDSKVWLLQ